MVKIGVSINGQVCIYEKENLVYIKFSFANARINPLNEYADSSRMARWSPALLASTFLGTPMAILRASTVLPRK